MEEELATAPKERGEVVMVMKKDLLLCFFTCTTTTFSSSLSLLPSPFYYLNTFFSLSSLPNKTPIFNTQIINTFIIIIIIIINFYCIL